MIDLLTFGVCMAGAVAAANHGDSLTMALMFIAAFWTVVRMVREKLAGL